MRGSDCCFSRKRTAVRRVDLRKKNESVVEARWLRDFQAFQVCQSVAHRRDLSWEQIEGGGVAGEKTGGNVHVLTLRRPEEEEAGPGADRGAETRSPAALGSV